MVGIYILKKNLKRILRLYFTWLVQRKIRKRCNSLKVNRYSSISTTTVLGENVNFNGMTIYPGGTVTIGNNFHSGSNCQIITKNHNFNGSKIPYDETYIIKDVFIEDNVWLGNNVIILAGVNIGEGSIIQAGSVVVSNIPKLAIAGGHPAKVFSKRDESHYLSLKKQSLFH